MAGKIINTLRYGDRRTKFRLAAMIGVAVFALVGGAGAFLFANATLGLMSGFVLLMDGIVLAGSNFSSSKTAVDEKTKKEKKEKKQKKPARADEDEDEGGALSWVSSPKKEKPEKKEREGKEEEEKETEKQETEYNPLRSYDGQKLKKLMFSYKVKKEHIPILIDYCKPQRILQCPAYLWRDTAYLYFLLFEEEPRMVKLPLGDAGKIIIRRGVPARPTEEYEQLQERSFISEIFSPYLPNYYQGDAGGTSFRTGYKKNLYSIGEDVWCTPPSMRNIKKILNAEFVLEDSKINSNNYSAYFKDIYVSRILFWDTVISGKEYREKVMEILTSLAKADVADDVFNGYLLQMVAGSLIPQEYADYAVAKRAKRK